MKTLLLTLALMIPGIACAGNLSSHAETQGFAVGTLAITGSFDFETAPVFTRVIMLGHLTQNAYKRHDITKAQAIAIKRSAQKAKNLAVLATRVCGQNAAGKCTKNKPKAEALLAKAYAVLAAI